MRRLNKTDIGLGLVRNRVVPSIGEFSALSSKVTNLISDEVIQGNLSTLSADSSSVSVDPNNPNTYVIDLSNSRMVKIVADVDNKSIALVGGEEGISTYIEFHNVEAYDVSWTNLRVQGGVNPGLSYNNTGDPTLASVTILEVVKLGGFYYMLNIFRQTPNYSLSALVADLNSSLDVIANRIRGFSGMTSGGAPINYNLGTYGALILGSTTTTNVADLDSQYDYVFEIPKSIMDPFYPGVIRYYIDQFEPDLTNYYIKIM